MLIKTFRNWEEPYQNQCILVCTLNMVLDVADREVYGVEVVLTGSNRGGSLVTP